MKPILVVRIPREILPELEAQKYIVDSFALDHFFVAFIAVRFLPDDVFNRLGRFAQEAFCLPLESHHRLESVL
jgi:hypothetical protein